MIHPTASCDREGAHQDNCAAAWCNRSFVTPAEMEPVVEEVMRCHCCAEWQSRLLTAEVPHAPVWNYAQLFAEQQTANRGLRVTVRDPQGKPVDLVGSPFHIAGTTLPAATMPPGLGQDTEAVLREVLGFDERQVAELHRRGVI